MKKNKIALAVVAATSLFMNGKYALAQESEPRLLEEVVVTGIRASLQRSLDVKRDADSVVDAISAQDIGQFPDQNLAESLQRVTGVSIDRDRGEGQFVSIRGLGPEFVQVTLNGRTAPSNDTGTRAFRFDQLQSELVNTLEVYKSPTADLSDGGLAGTVNIKTRRPLDLGERVINVGLAASYSDLSDETDPRVSGLFSDIYADGKFGFLIGASYSTRNLREDSAMVTGYAPFSFDVLDGESGVFARNIVARLYEEERERINLSTALQWQPNHDTLVSLDVFYADFEVTTNNNGLPFRSQNKLSSGATSVTLEDGLVTFLESETARPRLDSEDAGRQTETYIVGLNIDHQMGQLNVNGDIAWSSSDSDEFTDRVFYQPKGSDGTDLTYDIRSGALIPAIQLGSGDDLTDPSRFFLGRLSQEPVEISDEELQFRLDLEYELDGEFFTSVSGGVSYRDHERVQDGDDIRLRSAFPNDPITNISTSDLPVSDFLTGISAPGWPTQWLVPDARSAFNYFLGERGDEIPPELFTSEASQSLGRDFTITEETTAAYFRTNFESEIFSLPIRGNIGVRYVSTDQTSEGNVTPITGVIFQPAPIFEFGQTTPQTFEVDYSETLPSLNLILDVTDDVVIRFAAAKVLTRPAFDDLSPGTTNTNASTRTVKQGNPELEPLTADQLDLSFEWYFASTSAVSLGVFWKDIDSFINDVVVVEEFRDENGMTVPDPDTGENVTINIEGPRNEDGATVWGTELAYQMTFDEILPEPFDGLGFMANWTRVETDADFVNPNTLESFDIPGLSSDTYNVVVFYEKNKFSARVAYNYREEFLDQISGLGGNPVFRDTYEQWDAKIAYRINDQITFSLDVINIQDDNTVDFNELQNRNLLFEETNTGSRITAGLSMVF